MKSISKLRSIYSKSITPGTFIMLSTFELEGIPPDDIKELIKKDPELFRTITEPIEEYWNDQYESVRDETGDHDDDYVTHLLTHQRNYSN